jgi:peptidyl-prolyl cis-trans isomerase D
MQLFRRLAGNIFFKIILAFVALSFVLFGISGFILGNPNSWVAKVGKTTINYSTFIKAVQNDREAILASIKTEEALKYLESEQFKSEVLGRLVNRIMIEKLRDDFGVQASKKLILEAIATDPSFKNKEGKFDHDLFKKFLGRHGLNEEKYVNEIANDVTATMIVQSLSMASPINEKMIIEVENFKQEKRLADIITISQKNLQNNVEISDAELEKFFEKNKQKYALPEMRKISYIRFSRKNFAGDMQVSEKEILAEYEKNKKQFSKPESRNFYHILFEDKNSAQAFLQKLNEATKSDKSRLKTEFAKIAKATQKKDLQAITLAQITQKDLIPELADPVFKLSVNEISQILQSPLGFHLFLLNEIKASQSIPFGEVRNSIRQKMLKNIEDRVLQSKVAEIDDALLTANSLSEVAKKFNFKVIFPKQLIKHPLLEQNIRGKNIQNEKDEINDEINGLTDLAQNAFALKKGQISKVFYAQNPAGFYVFQIEDIEPARERKLSEVKQLVIEDLKNVKKHEALQNLAKKIGAEVMANSLELKKIAAKYHLKLEKRREFPRIFYINFQGRQIAYQNKFLDELFELKVGQVTNVLPAGEQEFIIGILREIKKIPANSVQIKQAKNQNKEDFKNEVLQEFNNFILRQNPVQVNEKIPGSAADKRP